MEAVLLPSSPDQSISPYNLQSGKQFPPTSRRSENFSPSNFHSGVLRTSSPFLSYSFPPMYPPHHQQRQPPLLPLPIYNSRTRGLSCPPIQRKINNRPKRQSPMLKNTKPKKQDPKPACSNNKLSQGLIVGSTNRLGPDPKDVSRVLSSSFQLLSSGHLSSNCAKKFVDVEYEVDKFSGSDVFTLSPPPSSLPLPTFSIRPKLSCNAEAAGIDAGATDSLRRILRLR